MGVARLKAAAATACLPIMVAFARRLRRHKRGVHMLQASDLDVSGEQQVN
jgi:hypothetical protein